MSSLLTPKRRERAKKKSRAAHSMSPSIRPSSSSSTSKSRPGRYQAMTDDDDGGGDNSPPRSGALLRYSNGSSGGSTIPPRTVTPTGSIASSTSFGHRHHRRIPQQPQSLHSQRQSWEDYEEGMYAPSSSSSVRKGGNAVGRSFSFTTGNTQPPVKVVSRTPSYTSKLQPTPSSSAAALLRRVSMDEQDQEPFDEDMPMDERMDRKQVNNQSIEQQERNLPFVNSSDADSSTYQSVTPGKEVTDMVSMMSASYDGGETTGVGRMIAALNNGVATRPSNLNREECILWDALQTVMVNDRNEHLSKRRNLERCLQESTAKLGQVSARETEMELELAKSKCECADLERKYTMALAENRVLVGQQGEAAKGNADDDNNNSNNKEEVEAAIQKIESMELTLKEKDGELTQQKKDHEAEVRAIQRVLADLTLEKMKLQDRLEQQESAMEERKAKLREGGETESTPPSDASRTISEEAHRAEIDNAADKLSLLQEELEHARMEANAADEEKKHLNSEFEAVKGDAERMVNEVLILKSRIVDFETEISMQKKQNGDLAEEIEALTRARDEAISKSSILDPQRPEVEHPKPETALPEQTEEVIVVTKSTDTPEDDVETLKEKLSETSSSLENAKKIIASLENANGSLALDLRAKLKAKEEELSATQIESDERKRRLDSLATELRDLQRKHGDMDKLGSRAKAQLIKQKALVGHLQTSMSDLQSAIVVHEVSVSAGGGVADRSSIEEISEILGDTLHAVKATLESTEELVEDSDDVSVANTDVEVSSEVGRHVDALIRNDREAAAKGLRSQLDQKRIAVKRLEEALKKQNEEMKKLRLQLDDRSRSRGESDEQLRAEIQTLRQQCSTNMEVLAKKERELSVLRSSLSVDENDAGYISDDASDDDNEDEDGESRISSPANLDSYGPADAEAFATILSQTSGGLEVSGRKREMETLKTELLKALSQKEAAAKELKAEQESLANAKMIISSLEKANKGMMEDLRSRLQDSNTAIASLLDKSMEHEKNAEQYQKEVERLKKERLEDQERLAAEVKKLQEELSTRDKSSNLTGNLSSEHAIEEKKEEEATADV